MFKKHMRYSSKKTDWILCFLSAGFLILAFPRTDLWACAWGGLIPLMFALDGKKPWAAFRSAYLCGFLFFAGTLYWFLNISRWFSWIAALGVLLLFLYLALYFGIFGLSYSYFSRRKPLIKLFLLPSAWVVLEFIRARLFTGFDWASLGHSQYKHLSVIQIADITGVFGISFIIVMVNCLLKEWITVFFFHRTPEAQKTLSVSVWVTAVVLLAVLGYGTYCLSLPDQQASRFSIAIIQANIPQEVKWHKPARAAIVQDHIALSEQAAAQRPDLIVWPETSYPDYLWEENELLTRVQSFVRSVKVPLLFGSVLHEGDDYYNAAILLSENGDVEEIYRKIHLVPFGEFIPMRRFLPFLTELLGTGDFTRGSEYTVFSHLSKPARKAPFSVLVCFEDTVARLSRQFVQKGAQLLINMTNDAWFGDTKAPFMHLQSSVFRTVENRRGLVRAANTGVGCAIDPWGRITNSVQGKNGYRMKATYVEGYTIATVRFNDKETFYTKFGDVFAIFCFGCILLGIMVHRDKY